MLEFFANALPPADGMWMQARQGVAMPKQLESRLTIAEAVS